MEARLANAFKLGIEGGDLVFEFGVLAQKSAASGPATVNVRDRFVLPLDIGRRLAVGLDLALLPHAANLRADAAKALPPANAATALRPGVEPVRRPPEVAGERAAQLLRMVGDLGVPYLYERSFRMTEGALMANRFLLTLDRLDIPGGAERRVLEICDRMGMPASARAEAQANLAMARCVHFGFEADSGVVCKLYLERSVTEEERASARAKREPALLHLAFKWDVASGVVVTSRYLWRPGLSAPQIGERLEQVYGDASPTSLNLARAVLKLVEGRAPAESLQYLEVEEAENARRSFDLNLYDAKLQVKDMQFVLTQMREHFGVRPGQWQALYDQIKTKALGHVAGGVHRNGEDFFNVYYGVVGLPYFHGGFGEAQDKP